MKDDNPMETPGELIAQEITNIQSLAKTLNGALFADAGVDNEDLGTVALMIADLASKLEEKIYDWEGRGNNRLYLKEGLEGSLWAMRTIQKKAAEGTPIFELFNKIIDIAVLERDGQISEEIIKELEPPLTAAIEKSRATAAAQRGV